MGHAPQRAGAHRTGASDLEGALGADATHLDGGLGLAQVCLEVGPWPSGPTPKRGVAGGQPLLALRRHGMPQIGHRGVAPLAQEPGRQGEGEIQPDREPLGCGLFAGDEVGDDTGPAAAIAQVEQGAVADMGGPDVILRSGLGAGPVDGHDVHGAQLSRSWQSLLTVFQFRVVLTTPRCRSRKVPVNLVLA